MFKKQIPVLKTKDQAVNETVQKERNGQTLIFLFQKKQKPVSNLLGKQKTRQTSFFFFFDPSKATFLVIL
jgi:hypothetical protein